jgi:hypothetical protein
LQLDQFFDRLYGACSQILLHLRRELLEAAQSAILWKKRDVVQPILNHSFSSPIAYSATAAAILRRKNCREINKIALIRLAFIFARQVACGFGQRN